MKKNISVIIILFTINFGIAQDFKILNNNISKRRNITHKINSNGFILGINRFGGGYITGITIPGLGNIMGVQAQKYGRGGQSSIRDMGRGGQYNPTQAGFGDNAGTECAITTVSPSKLIIPSRGCALYNGDGKFDYTEWENIIADHPNISDAGNTDQDGIEESNLSVTINGQVFTKQEAEVHSDFDFYGEYEDYTPITGVSIPAIRHYYEYRFVRSSTEPKSAMKQFNESSLKAVGKWDDDKFPSDISAENPIGVHPGGIDHLNTVQMSWSIRNDVEIWDPEFRYKVSQNGVWEIETRTNKASLNYIENYKLRFIIADNANENQGHALGFYLPPTHMNKFNIVGVKESTNSEVYEDNRTIDNFYLDIRYRNSTSTMSWIGFRSRFNGLIDRSHLTGDYEGVYEKVRQETILLTGTPAEIKAAFVELDQYYADLLSANTIESEAVFKLYPNPTNDKINIFLKNNPTEIQIFNLNGQQVYASNKAVKEISIPISEIGEKGIYLIKANEIIRKLVIN
ncbi:T9SS type A sorting domain-containing protein [Flavicella sediminum]|uniref:T9SS type A sorting domain-containing protein n=1 Tax=Flavicella sediminum TaxID=2585141 RepID=UPI001120EBB1|nr:T9SS type A sorting domain-containing protein [Flavicella sediminum]